MKVFLIVILVLLHGCGVITKTDWEEAEKACAPFGGIKLVYVRGLSAVCSNGIEVEGFNTKGIVGS